MEKQKKYGWKPDLPDHRDLKLCLEPSVIINLPPLVDLRPLCPPVLNQGNIGSCTAHALTNAYRFEQMRQKQDVDFVPSRLFIYYNERLIEGCVDQDSGAQLRDGIKTLNQQGVCSETTWPYLVEQFTTKPPQNAYDEAIQHEAIKYQRVTQTLDQMKGCLANGYPFVFGFTVYESFEGDEVAKTGIVPMPNLSEECLGGHAVGSYGFSDDKQAFLVMNSWGEDWGEKGFFWLPYAYLSNDNLANDLWTIQLVKP